MTKDPIKDATSQPPTEQIEGSSINGHLLTPDEESQLLALNNQYAHCINGSKHRIVSFKTCEVYGKRLVFETIYDFNHNFAHLPTIANFNLGKAWVHWHGKRFYPNGMGYYPGPKPCPEGVYNTFQGLGLIPTPGDCGPFITFIREIICAGDDKITCYLLDFIAHMVQKPCEKPSVAILLKSVQGTGKGTFYRLLKEILGNNACQVNGQNDLTSRFNSALSNNLLIFGDEVNLNNQAIYDKIKAIISEPNIFIESKGVDKVPLANYARYIFAGNLDYIIRAEPRERRFLVLEPSVRRVGDHDYWHELNNHIDSEMSNFFLDFLLKRDITNFNPYQAPITPALIQEQIANLTAPLRYVYEQLLLPTPFGGQQRIATKQVIDSFCRMLSDEGEKMTLPKARSLIGKLFKDLNIQKDGRSDVRDGQYYLLPAAEELQIRFAQLFGYLRQDIFNTD